MKVKLLNATPNATELIYKAYRVCYSKYTYDEIKVPSQADMEDFIKDKMDKQHFSPLEHVNFTFYIEGISRACLAQLTRHRTFKFNCVSGDTVLYRGSNKVKKTTIKEFYDMEKQYQDMSTIRCVDIDTKELVQTKVLNIVNNGIKPVYELTTKNGYNIKSTLDHRFLTKDGWKELKDIKIGDKVYTNGIEAYKDKEWLNTKYNVENLSQQEIGDLCGVSKHTIRFWVRKYGLQKELGNWSVGKEPPNKGKTKYNYEPTRIASEKMKGNTNTANRIYTDVYDDITKMSNEGKRYRAVRSFVRTSICEFCGEKSRDIHHKDMDLNNIDSDNLVELCTKCHETQHSGATVKVIQLMEVTDINYIGEEEVYDIEVEHKDHNFIGNGFVLHNCQSQRYVDAENFDFIEPDLNYIIDDYSKNEATMGFKNIHRLLLNAYKELLSLGVKKEDARGILPNDTTCNLIVNCDLRNFRNFLSQRLCNHAQAEIKELAHNMCLITEEHFPLVKYRVMNCDRCNGCKGVNINE